MPSIKPRIFSLVALSTLSFAAWADDPAARTVGRTFDDATITANVKGKLLGDPVTKARQINVETRSGIVQLNGFVDSAKSRDEAARIASGADGVSKVHNNLEVRTQERSAGEVMDDIAVSAKVDAALAVDSHTSALHIDVATNLGEVQLSGFAKSQAEKDAAKTVASKVEGVRMVNNAIDVR